MQSLHQALLHLCFFAMGSFVDHHVLIWLCLLGRLSDLSGLSFDLTAGFDAETFFRSKISLIFALA